MSENSFIYGISGEDEARAYLRHPVLSERLYKVCGELLLHKDKSAYRIFGEIDDMKLRSSMTLFAAVSDEDSVFHKVLECFFNGEMDEATLRLLRR